VGKDHFQAQAGTCSVDDLRHYSSGARHHERGVRRRQVPQSTGGYVVGSGAEALGVDLVRRGPERMHFKGVDQEDVVELIR
jgi:hypothetical protein